MEGLCALIERFDPNAAPTLYQQPGSEVVLTDRYRRPAGVPRESTFNLGAGSVTARMENSRDGVRPFLGQVYLTVERVEGDSQRHEFADTGGAFRHHRHDGIRVAQPRAGNNRVAPVQRRTVARGDRSRYPTLRVTRVGLRETTLGQNQNRTTLARVVGGVETCNAAADDNVVECSDSVSCQRRLQATALS